MRVKESMDVFHKVLRTKVATTVLESVLSTPFRSLNDWPSLGRKCPGEEGGRSCG